LDFAVGVALDLVAMTGSEANLVGLGVSIGLP